MQKKLWTEKYVPKKFHELLSYEKINREILTWLKSWDPIVFPKKKTEDEEENDDEVTPLKNRLPLKNSKGKISNYFFMTPNKNPNLSKPKYDIKDK